MEVPTICLVIQTGRHCLLVDTGSGRYKPTTGRLISNLSAAGIDPLAIDVVVLTHAHGDHIGGLRDDRGALAFAHARYVILQQEWEYWMSNPDLTELPIPAEMRDLLRSAATRQLSAIESKLDCVEPGTEIVPGVAAIAAFGHTPGHMAVEVTSAHDQLLFVADAIVDPINLEYPEARCVTDSQPEQTVRTRRSLLERAAAENPLVAATHFPFPGLGRVGRRDEGWAWRPVSVTEPQPL
jgi:glyoxylase-like metal-dependent hydrolase (beta-lactamase superfamily II)